MVLMILLFYGFRIQFGDVSTKFCLSLQYPGDESCK